MTLDTTQDGIPSITHDGKPVIAADAIALLSGVNFNSVRKMLAAVHALHAFTGVSLDELLDLAKCPQFGVDTRTTRDAVRAESTLVLCEGIIDSGDFDYLDGTYLIFSRFP